MESQPSSNSCAFLPGSTKQAERSDHCGWAVPCFDRSRGGARLPVGAHLATSAARSTTLLRRVGCHLAQLLTEQFQKWPQGQGAPGQFPIWLREKKSDATKSKPAVAVFADIKKNLLAMDYRELGACMFVQMPLMIKCSHTEPAMYQNYRFFCSSLVSLQLIFTSTIKR